MTAIAYVSYFYILPGVLFYLACLVGAYLYGRTEYATWASLLPVVNIIFLALVVLLTIAELAKRGMKWAAKKSNASKSD